MFEDILYKIIAEVRIRLKCTTAMRFVSRECILNALRPSTLSPSSRLFRAGKSFSVQTRLRCFSTSHGPFYQQTRFNQTYSKRSEK